LNTIGINPITPITFLKAGFISENLSHIISFRRQTYVKKEVISKLPNSIIINFDNTEYRIFLTDDTLTCYLCKRTGHTSPYCKNTIAQNQILSEYDKENTFRQPETQTDNIDISNNTFENLDSSQTSQHPDSNKKENPINTRPTPSNILSHTAESTQLSSTITTTQNKTPKRPLSDSSSLKSPNILPSASNISSIENATKKTKMRSRSNSSCKSDTKTDKEHNPIKLLFKIKDTLPISYLQFKYILDNFTNKFINIHSLCEDANIDTFSLMDLIDKIRPIASDKALKTRLTKLSNLIFQTLPTR
jgi:hypothetical protein